jgi:hypothetical protein
VASININNEYLALQVIHLDGESDVAPHEGAAIRLEASSHDAMHFGQVIIDSESAHRIGDIYARMRAKSNGTHYYSDVSYDLLVALDAAWVEQNHITRETFRF